MDCILTNARILAADSPNTLFAGDVHIHQGLIADLVPQEDSEARRKQIPESTEIIDCQNGWLVPGFVQTHIHLVQTLFRGLADDLELMDWLQERIWPLESSHDADSVYWSARLGITELLLGGTTAILDMATVHHTEAVFQAASEAGIRAQIGQAMMDRPNESGLCLPTDRLLEESCALADEWHGRDRLGYAFAPRFVPSCTENLLTRTLDEARRRGCRIHTHASENREEVELVRSLTGMDNVEYLSKIGMTGPDVVLAHCIHLTDNERRILRDTETVLAHCPGSNMKLASGIAPIPELLEMGVHCTIGADGAPCNNRLDVFAEMRLAALIQKPRLGAAKMPAATVMDMATRNGARALGLDTGILAVGRPADIVLLDPDAIFAWGDAPPASTIVYGMTPAAVRRVWIQGQAIVENGSVNGWSTDETIEGCRQAVQRVRKRAKR